MSIGAEVLNRKRHILESKIILNIARQCYHLRFRRAFLNKMSPTAIFLFRNKDRNAGSSRKNAECGK